MANARKTVGIVSASIILSALTSTASGQLRISQVGKGSGLDVNANNGKFVELYNAGSTPVSLNGKSIQWASTAGGASWGKFDLSGTIAPGGYWLVRLSSTNTGNPADGFGVPFDADQTVILFNGTYQSAAGITPGNGAGKVALVNTTTTLTTNGCSGADVANVIDLVSWDDVASTAVCHEGSALALIPLPGQFAGGIGSTAVLRKCGGTIDTNDNFNDFISYSRPPRNSSFTGNALAPAVSGMTQVIGRVERATITGYAGENALFLSSAASCSGSISSITINLSSIGGSATQQMFDNGTNGDVVAGDGVYSYLYTIPTTAALGYKLLPIQATDSSGLVGEGLAPIQIAPVPPANDLCVNAETLTGGTLPLTVSATGNLISAGPITQIAASCTTNGGNTGTSRDVWYAFTPSVTAQYTVSTCNAVTAPGLFTSQDTVVEIYSSCPDAMLTSYVGLPLACNDNGCTNFIGGSPSTIFGFPMDAGVTYFIRVARFGSNSGVVGAPFRLDITSESLGACCTNGLCSVGAPAACVTGTYQGDGTTCSGVSCPPAPAPSNDDCSTAVALQLGIAEPGTSFGATGTDITVCDLTSWDVWYTFTPASTGQYRVTTTRTLGSQTPAIAIFAVCPPVADTSLACIAPPLSGLTNTLTFAATSGTQYYIRTATNFSQRAEYTVVISQDGGVCCRGSTCTTGLSQSACVASGLAGASFVSASSCNAGSAVTPCCYADFNKTAGTTVQDIFDFLNAWFAGSSFADVGGDGSGTPGVQDIFDFLNAWFAGC